MSALPAGLAAFCKRRDVDTSAWLSRGKLRLTVDGMTIRLDAPRQQCLRLFTRLIRLPDDPRERERLIDLAMLRVTGRSPESPETLLLTDDNVLCVERLVQDTDTEHEVASALEQFSNAVSYWRHVTTPA